MRTMGEAMPGTSKAAVGGVLSVIAGGSAILGGVVLATLGILGSSALVLVHDPDVPNLVKLLPLLFFYTLAMLLFVSGGLAVAGGVSALQRRSWGMALAGSIAAVLCVLPLGVPAVILIVMAEAEFRRTGA
jgi:hypothetical protein